MSYMKFITQIAPIDGHILLDELRVRLQKLPSVILSLIGNLRLP